MLVQNTNIWDLVDSIDIICVTTNLCTDSFGNAVMGAGIAKQAKDRYPDAPKKLGKALAERKNYPVPIATDKSTTIYSFPTKVKYIVNEYELLPQYKKKWTTGATLPGWMGYSSIELIRQSALYLKNIVIDKTIALPLPGCGAGQLDSKVVKELLDSILTEDRFILCSI